MGLKEVGRTGVQVNLTADGVTGVVTQDPESMLHSLGGLTNADGNVAFGVPLKVLAYFTHTTTAASQTTTATPVDGDAPFKFRVVGVKVRSAANVPERMWAKGGADCTVMVWQGDGGTTEVWSPIVVMDVRGLATDDVLEAKVLDLSNVVVDEDESLRVQMRSAADGACVGDTLSMVVEVEVLRVI